MKATRYPSHAKGNNTQRRKAGPKRRTPRRPRRKEFVTSGVRTERLLPELDQVSDPVENTCTPEHMMVFFSGFFARFHERGSGYIPYELQTVDCPIVGADGVPALDEAGNPLLMGCVREVARSQSGEEETWLMITWEVGIPGLTMTPCGTLAEAKGLLRAPPTPIVWSGWERWRERCARQAVGCFEPSGRAEHTQLGRGRPHP